MYKIDELFELCISLVSLQRYVVIKQSLCAVMQKTCIYDSESDSDNTPDSGHNFARRRPIYPRGLLCRRERRYAKYMRDLQAMLQNEIPAWGVCAALQIASVWLLWSSAREMKNMELTYGYVMSTSVLTVQVPQVDNMVKCVRTATDKVENDCSADVASVLYDGNGGGAKFYCVERDA